MERENENQKPSDVGEEVRKLWLDTLGGAFFDELSIILNKRRSQLNCNNKADPDKRYEVVTWRIDKEGFAVDHHAVSGHATMHEAEAAQQRFNARAIYADIVALQRKHNPVK